VKAYLIRSFRELSEQPRAELLDRRYEKFRKIGVFETAEVGLNGVADPLEE
jgi:acetyl-CoA carboxylase carboxyl transferase subunit alpha